MALCSNCILLVVACNLQIISWIWTMGNLILSCNGPSLDKQNKIWLVEPLIYPTCMSYGRFSLIRTAALVWLVSESLQAHFQVAFGLFQADIFCHVESHGISPWPKQLQETQVPLHHVLFGVAEYFYWQSILGDLLGDEIYCAKTFQTCICLQSERFFGVKIFEHGGTGTFLFDGIQYFSMFRSLYK